VEKSSLDESEQTKKGAKGEVAVVLILCDLQRLKIANKKRERRIQRMTESADWKGGGKDLSSLAGNHAAAEEWSIEMK